MVGKNLLVEFSPSIFQSYSLVEYRMLCCCVEVGHEVADALELQILAWLLGSSIFLNIAVGEGVQALRVEQLAEVALVS